MKRQLLRAGAIYGIANVVSAGVPFLLIPILTRALSPADYGLVINFYLLVTLSISVAGLSVHGAVAAKWFDRSGRDFPRLVGTAVLLAVCSTLLCSLVLLACAHLLRSELDLAPRFWVLAAVNAGATVVIGVRAALWQSQGHALRAASLQVVTASLNVGLSLLGVFALSMGGEGRIYGSVVASVVCACAAAWLLFGAHDARLALARTDVRELLRFGIPLIPHALAGAILVTSDRFAVSALLGGEALGIYGTAAQIGMVMGVLGDAMSKASLPWIFSQLAARTPLARLRVVGATYALIPVWLSIAVGLWIALKVTGSLILGQSFAPAINLSIWFLLGGAASAVYFNIAGLFFFNAKNGWLSFATFSSALVAVILAPTLIHALGLVGGALSFLSIQVCSLTAYWCLSTRIQPMPWHRPALALRALRGAWNRS